VKLKSYNILKTVYIGPRFHILFFNYLQQMAEVSSKMSWLKRGGRVRPGDGKKEPSLASSMESLTQSQLNLAIMDMLNLGQNWNRCEEVCRGKTPTPVDTSVHV
jgi:hypothetical protein